MRKTTTLTINSIEHHIQSESILSINGNIYKVIKEINTTTFELIKLKFYERWYYSAKSFIRRIYNNYQYIVK